MYIQMLGCMYKEGKYENEVITIRVDEKTKLKLLQQSQNYNTNLSKFMLDD